MAYAFVNIISLKFLVLQRALTAISFILKRKNNFKNKNQFYETTNLCDPIKVAVTKSQNHPNIVAMKDASIEEILEAFCDEANDVSKGIHNLEDT